LVMGPTRPDPTRGWPTRDEVRFKQLL